MPDNAVPPPPPVIPPPLIPQRDTGMLVLSYLWLLALIPFLTVKNDPEVRWHAKHGLVLTAAEFVVLAGFSVMTFVMHPLVLLYPFAWLAFVVLHVFAIVKALNGQRLIIPEVSAFADKF